MNLNNRTIYEQFLVKHLMQTNALFTHRISEQIHIPICKEMGYNLETKQSTHQFVLFTAPPGFGKSLWVTYIKTITDHCMHLQDQIIIACNNANLVQDKIRLIKSAYEFNTELAKEYGREQSEPWTNQHLAFKDGSYIVGFGRGQSTRGWRSGLIIMDDIENKEDMKSDVERARTEDWVESDLMTRLHPKGQMCFIQTNSAYLCYANKILKNMDGRFNHWFVKEFSAVD